MRIYVFISKSDPDVLAFTFDETGAGLPSVNGWRPVGDPDLFFVGTEGDPILEAVRRDGFYICNWRAG
jgi:hypothetical protein